MLIALKILFLFIAIWISLIYVGRLIVKQQIPALTLIAQAISITGFIYCQFFI